MKNLHQSVLGNILREIVDPAVIIDEYGYIMDSNSFADKELNITGKKQRKLSFRDAFCKNIDICNDCPIRQGPGKICKLGDNEKTYHIEAISLNLKKQKVTLVKLKPMAITFNKDTINADIKQGSVIGMVVTEEDGTITYADEQFFKLSCLHEQAVVGQKISSIFPDGQSIFSNGLDSKVSNIENQFIHVKCQEPENQLLQASMLTLPGDVNRYFWFFYPVTSMELLSEPNQKEYFFNAVVQSSSFGFGVLTNSKILFVNNYISEITGYSVPELIGKQFDELFSDRKDVKSLLGEVEYYHKTSPEHIYKTIWKKKDKTPIKITLKVVSENHVSLKNLIFIVIDYSIFKIENKNIAEQAFSQKSEYEELFMKMVYGFALCETIYNDEGKAVDFKYLAVNPGYARLLEIDETDIVGKTGHEVLPELEDEWYEKYTNVASGGQPALYVNHNEKKRKYFETTVYSHAKDKFAILVHDVSQRIKSRNELESIFNLSIDLICIADLEGNFIKANPSFHNILGFTKNDLSNRKIQELIFTSKSEAEAEALLLDINNEDTVVNYQSSFIDYKGNEIWLSWTMQTLSKEKTIFAIGRDITQIKKTEQEFISAKEKAEDGDRLKSAFLANMSHEVRTPMNAIIGFSSLLDNDDLEKDKRLKYIQIIKGRCNDLLRIIDDIIDISRIEAGQLDIFPEPFYVSDFINEVLEIYQYRLEALEKTHLNIVVVPLDENFQVYNDRQRLLQVINNLLDNAIKFTPKGTITIGCKNLNESKLMFYVKDTGIGIPQDKFDIIFHRFRQAEENLSRKFGGNGLGLAISKPLVKLMGGELWLESEVNVGSQFYFTIDKIKGEKQKEQPTDFRNKNILLVEDDKHSVGYYKIVLEQFGATISHARTGYDAINMLKHGAKFDLILMDIQLSDMSGLEVTKMIREKDKKTPIIAQTAYARQTDRKTCLSAGCNDYIAKPIDNEDLISLVNRYVRK